jgi:isoleucyl-tRNA synthetase
MSRKFREYKKLELSKVNKNVLEYWHSHGTFRKSIEKPASKGTFIFYEGPPSANGIPGIHHVMARTIKDIFCRYKTMQGYLVERKAGWDTHGLPVELGVEKALGITKEDIGKKISIADYNKACRKDVMKYTDLWEELTEKMGYWVDMHDPYITYDNRYIETLWWLLRKLYDKGLLYKGYTIQPYSPAAGTGLSTHELNQPGCYRDVKDTTVVAQFKVIRNEKSEFLYKGVDTDLFFLAWTTTPWTLPSNTALAVGKEIVYVKVRTFNPYTGIPVTLILAKDLLGNHLNPKFKDIAFEDYKEGAKELPYKIIAEYKGADFNAIRYEQLIPFHQPKDGDAFRVVLGDFVTTEEGTGIVHIAPSFGADDFRVAKENGIGALTLVDKQGRFVDGMGDFSHRFVKNEYDPALTENDNTVDVDIAVMLKKDNKAFKIEKYVHTYPHCWRTDKPVLYYPLDSWFIKTTAMKDRMIELNNTINWKPQSTGTGRFGKWLENLQDWNLSRSRYWGTPLPIWRTEDGLEEMCIGSLAELKSEIGKAVANGYMKSNPLADYVEGDNSKENYEKFDLHRPFVDEILLVSASGKPMKRELDLIDVWFDSGAMPYAQYHYPFEASPLTPSNRGGDVASNTKFYKTADKSVYELIRVLSDKNKKRPTEAESLLWEHLRGKQLDGYKFRRQHIIADFIVDFVCLSGKLIVEIDGGYHNDAEITEADQYRTQLLNQSGFKVIRFTNEQVIGDINKVLSNILENLKKSERQSSKSVSPLTGGPGGAFPADFIAEGVDQTRGWFFTLHAIAVMLFDSVAFKNIVSNGLVLDKNGNKMSKRLGNAVDPFDTIEKYGSDPLRWYMITNASPWDNLKFDMAGVEEVTRKFFGTLYNTYSFFALYANVDGFTGNEAEVPVKDRPEIDRWIISLLNSLVKEVDESYADYEPTRAGRAISDFVAENLSNWYVRLNRKRFWGGQMDTDKLAAYQTLYTCLVTVAKLASPIAPFYMDQLFMDLTNGSGNDAVESVHLEDFPKTDIKLTDKDLEEKMDLAQHISSLVLGLRRKVNIKVRQPLQKIMVPILDNAMAEKIDAVKKLIFTEVNVKELEYISDTTGILVKKIKPNFKTLGPKYGKQMKGISAAIAAFSQLDIAAMEQQNRWKMNIDGVEVDLTLDDVEIMSEDIPGWLVASEGRLTVALDVTLTPELIQEGIARELINRIQNLRKDNGFDVTDKISIEIQKHSAIIEAIDAHRNYIATQTLAQTINWVEKMNDTLAKEVEIDDDIKTLLKITRIN